MQRSYVTFRTTSRWLSQSRAHAFQGGFANRLFSIQRFEGTKEAARCNSSITRPEPLYDGKRPGRTERAPLRHSASAITTGTFAYNALRSVCLSGGAPERLGWCRWIQTRFLRPAQRANKKGRIGCPLATDPALSSKQDNRYLPEPTSAGNKPARALSCSTVVRFPEDCDAFWPFTATPSYLRASMILSSAAFIEIPLSQLMAAVPLFTATVPLKNAFRIPLLVA